METFYYILLMYAGSFAIGMLVAAIIWLLLRSMSISPRKKRSRQSFQELKQIQ